MNDDLQVGNVRVNQSSSGIRNRDFGSPYRLKITARMEAEGGNREFTDNSQLAHRKPLSGDQ